MDDFFSNARQALPFLEPQLLQRWFLPSVLLIFLTALLVNKRIANYPKLPPGPPGLPVVGHLLWVRKKRPGHFGQLISEIEKKYGPILTLWFGSVPFIVLSSPEIVHEAMVEKGSLFASRPTLRSRAMFTINFHSISSAPYGQFWRTVRRNMVSKMLNSAKIKSFKPARGHIINSMIQKMGEEAAENDGVVTIYPKCRFAIFKIFLFMCFGRHLEDSVAAQLDEMQTLVIKNQSAFLGDYIPILGFFDKKAFRERINLRKTQQGLFISVIEEHKRLQKASVSPGNYVDTLLNLEFEEGAKLTDAEIFSLCTEFLTGGTDTTVTALEWAMANLVIHKDIQAMLYSEIEQVVGKRPVEEEDLVKMPYLQAIIKETLRLHPPGHFTLPHAVTKPCKLAGYDIPANATVIVHLASLSRDSKIWNDPLKFKPERFFANEIDITGSKQVTMIPFSAGRRICPGADLALMHADLILARMIQAFEWSNPNPGEVMDMSEKQNFTIVMNTSLRASIKERC